MSILDIQFFILVIPILAGLVLLHSGLNRKPKKFISEAGRTAARAYLKNQTHKQRKRHNGH